MVVKFNSFWMIELEFGWLLMVVYLVNWMDLLFCLFSGLVDVDCFNEVGINFLVLWIDEGFEGVLLCGMLVV